MKALKAELLAIHPEAMLVTLGTHRVWRFQVQTPAHTFESVVKPVDDRLLQLTARDSFDESLARAILDRLKGQSLPTHGSAKIRVVPVTFPPPWAFDCLVIVPPRVAGRFANQSKRLRQATYWIVPAFRAEFEDGASGETFWHQVYRKDDRDVPVVQWDRSQKTQPVSGT